jgi:hypothetical protein
MANLRDLTINQPTSMDQITFDPRTRQYHDIANRYRMVRQSVVESLQRGMLHIQFLMHFVEMYIAIYQIRPI